MIQEKLLKLSHPNLPKTKWVRTVPGARPEIFCKRIPPWPHALPEYLWESCLFCPQEVHLCQHREAIALLLTFKAVQIKSYFIYTILFQMPPYILWYQYRNSCSWFFQPRAQERSKKRNFWPSASQNSVYCQSKPPTDSEWPWFLKATLFMLTSSQPSYAGRASAPPQISRKEQVQGY